MRPWPRALKITAAVVGVIVHHEAEDPDSLISEIQSVMRSEDWREDGNDGMWWHLGPWGVISAEDNKVQVFIGVIEG